MKIGQHTVHSNHLRLVYNSFDVGVHGLIQEDVVRTDRQNFRSAQRVAFTKVQNCLQRMISGDIEDQAPDPSLAGTFLYLKVLWCYCEIFLSGKATLEERIMYASLVIHFLGIWHNDISRRQGVNLTKNFLSRQCYIDILLSCHAAVTMICYMRLNDQNVPCHLELTGTDVAESFFSTNGQWVGNRHNYCFARLERNLTHMVRLEEIRANLHAPHFARPHPKVELIWKDQHEDDWKQADLSHYPTQNEILEAWRNGAAMAREWDFQGGITDGFNHIDGRPIPPNHYNEHEYQVHWFFQPFQDRGNNLYDAPEYDTERCLHDDESSIPSELQSGHTTLSATSVVHPGLDMQHLFHETNILEESQEVSDPGLSDEVPSLSAKFSPTVIVPHSQTKLYKATLVSSLNSDPHLSHDRLKRVRQRQEYSMDTSLSTGPPSDFINLFDDYCIVEDQKNNSHYMLGQVSRVIHKGKDFCKPVAYTDPRAKDMMFFVLPYMQIGETDTGEVLYNKQIETMSVKLKQILIHVNLSVHSTKGCLCLSAQDNKQLQIAVRKLQSPSSNRKNRKRMEASTDDGRRVTVVDAVPNETPSRRSTRTRFVFQHECV